MEARFKMNHDLIDYYNFMIRVLIKNIQSEYMSKFFKEEVHYDIYRLVPFFRASVFADDERLDNFSLEGKNVITFPYEHKKMFGAMKDVRDEGYRHEAHETDKPDGIYFPELNLALIHNGQHHIAAACDVGFKGVKAYVFVISLEKALDVVTFSEDSELWVYDNKERRIEDCRFAMLFELYRRRRGLEKKMEKNTAIT